MLLIACHCSSVGYPAGCFVTTIWFQFVHWSSFFLSFLKLGLGLVLVFEGGTSVESWLPGADPHGLESRLPGPDTHLFIPEIKYTSICTV